METLKQVTTDWVHYREHGSEYIARLTYGFDTDFAKRHKQNPHFSMTGETWRKREPGDKLYPGDWFKLDGVAYVADSGGQCREVMQRYFPEVWPIQVWHLSSLETGPMHYVANGLYWLGEKNEDHFKSTVCYGYCASDGIMWGYPPYQYLTAAWERRRRAFFAFKSEPCTETRGELGDAERYVTDMLDAIEFSLASAGDYLRERLPTLLANFRCAMVQYGLLVETETQSESERG